ncbi:TatD family hydrolase [Candidatus Riflebacteria bacterium]
MSDRVLRLIDSHLHLQEPEFAEDLEVVLQRASDLGVQYFICNGTCEEDWPRLYEISQKYQQIIPCFGLHPWLVAKRSKNWLSLLEEFLTKTGAPLGEIGLDCYKKDRDENEQEEVFRAQLKLACRLKIPVMIHCVRAWDWLLHVLGNEAPLPAGFLIHAYGGGPEYVSPLAQMGAYFSFTASVLKKKNTRQQDSLRAIPHDRLMLETDAPDFAPAKGFRTFYSPRSGGRLRNEPGNLPAIFRGVAEILQESENKLAQRLWQNGFRFLKGFIKEQVS